MKILIVGAGGHGKVVAEVAEDLGYEVAFLDDNAPDAVGKIEDIEKWTSFENAFCGIGNNKFRMEVLKRLKNAGYNIPALIHPTAYISKSATIGCGAIIEPKAIVNANSNVGMGTIVSVGAIVDHDVTVGECAHINAGAIVKGGGSVADYEKLEAGEVRLGYAGAIVKK